MDIANIMDVEKPYTFELLHPATEEPVGVKITVRSLGADETLAQHKKYTDKDIERIHRRKIPTTDQLTVESIDKAVSYIIDWDWYSEDFTWADKKKPEFNPRLAKQIMSHKNMGWFYEQVVKAATTVTNFIPPSETKS